MQASDMEVVSGHWSRDTRYTTCSYHGAGYQEDSVIHRLSRVSPDVIQKMWCTRIYGEHISSMYVSTKYRNSLTVEQAQNILKNYIFFFGLTYPPCPYVQDQTIATLRLIPNVLKYCCFFVFLHMMIIFVRTVPFPILLSSFIKENNVKGLRPSALIFHEWNKNCFLYYSFSSSVIEYKSNEKLIKAWSGARFYKNQHYVLSWYEENLTQ